MMSFSDCIASPHFSQIPFCVGPEIQDIEYAERNAGWSNYFLEVVSSAVTSSIGDQRTRMNESAIITPDLQSLFHQNLS